MIDRLLLEDLRCFHDEQLVSLAPLTFLVGENSTGKSTFLASARIAWDLFRGKADIDFNEAPFRLGAFDQLANYRGGRAARASRFRIGMVLSTDGRGRRRPSELKVVGCFESRGGQPALRSWVGASSEWRVETTFGPEEAPGEVKVTGPDADFTFRSGLLRGGLLGVFSELEYMSHFLGLERDLPGPMQVSGKLPNKKGLKAFERFVEAIRYGGLHWARGGVDRPQAIAPIRTTPQRTYDPTKDEPSPEGGHVPMVLARLSLSSKREWEPLKSSLEAFGEASGLFNRISVRRLGGKQSAPFQLRVHIKGPEANLVDVGYGVSQVLPILVDCLRAGPGSTMLLQQPEVHLHPRAQAELGNFLARLSASEGRQLLVETHSDYLIDRVRMLVRSKEDSSIQPPDVRILFFERQGTTVRIHELGIDELGNVVGAPPSYRAFFLAEERRFWS